MNEVRDYYDRHVKYEDKRLEENVFEIPITLKYIEKYVKPGSKILDVSCGTGRYARLLLDKGYKLGLNDLSENNMKLTMQRVGSHPGVLHTDTANALETDIWGKEEWDAILILGPLYHLTDQEKRLRLLHMAENAVKTNGYIYLAFMSRIGALLYGLKRNPEGIEKPNGAYTLWETGTDTNFVEGTEWFTNAYFVFPEEIDPFVWKAGLEPLHLAGVEGIFGENMHLYHNLNERLKKKWMEFILNTCEDMHMIDNSKHLLSVGKKLNRL
ncbi:MAG: class I SAM-dependent methyltransferase [Bacteroidota bacterium]